MKKKLLVIILIVIVISGCSGGETENDLTSIADNGMNKAKQPEGCPIVDINENEIPISWEYNNETDDEQNTPLGVIFTDVDNIIYKIGSVSFLEYYDKNSMSKSLLCGKPDCEHNNEETCNAYVSSMSGLQYYNGCLYTVQMIDKLTKISLDGAIRENAGNLMTVETATGGLGGSIRWLIHRGYIYYYYRCGSGMTEDTYYLNNSNCIYRMNLEDKTKECIMVFPVTSESNCIMQGVGSYIYMNMVENEKGGYLYRFNTETTQLERLESIGNDISGYAVCDDRLYYLRKDDAERKAELYCFEYGNKETKLIDTYSADGSNMYCDNDFIYVYILYNNTHYIKTYDRIGNYITDIALGKENEIVIWEGTDSTRIYFYKILEESLYYVEKSKLLYGEPELKTGD